MMEASGLRMLRVRQRAARVCSWMVFCISCADVTLHGAAFASDLHRVCRRPARLRLLPYASLHRLGSFVAIDESALKNEAGPGVRGRMRLMRRHAVLSVSSLLDASAIANLRGQVAAWGVLGRVSFLAAFVVSQLVVLVPVTPCLVLGALLFDAPWSYIMVSLGVVCSSASGFYFARFVFKPQVQRFLGSNVLLQKISSAVALEGRKIAILARSSLVLPPAPMTFAFGGLTSIRFPDFFLATVLCSLPEAWVTVYAATSAQGLLSNGAPWYVFLVALASLAALVATIARISQRALNDSIEK